MKKYFMASICREGILGGGILADDTGFTWATNKVSVSTYLKRIEMKYADIKDVEKNRLLCFPAVTVRMKDESSLRFILFRRNLFLAGLEEGRAGTGGTKGTGK